MAIQSLNELESFYPGWLESELYSRSNYENANPSNDFISFPSNSNFSSVHRFNSSLLQQLPSFKTFSALNQTEAAKSQSLMELYRREKTQCFADLLILILEISLNAVKKQVFQPETLKSANYEKLNSENLTGRLLNNEVSIPQKLQDLIKKIISHIISDMNLVSYFSKTLVLDYLTVFLNITKMSSKVLSNQLSIKKPKKR